MQRVVSFQVFRTRHFDRAYFSASQEWEWKFFSLEKFWFWNERREKSFTLSYLFWVCDKIGLTWHWIWQAPLQSYLDIDWSLKHKYQWCLLTRSAKLINKCLLGSEYDKSQFKIHKSTVTVMNQVPRLKRYHLNNQALDKTKYDIKITRKLGTTVSSYYFWVIKTLLKNDQQNCLSKRVSTLRDQRQFWLKKSILDTI